MFRAVSPRLELGLDALVHVENHALTHPPPEDESGLLVLSLSVPILLRFAVFSTDGITVRVGAGLEPRLLAAAISDHFSELDTSRFTLRLPFALQVQWPVGDTAMSLEVRVDRQLTALIPTYDFTNVTALLGVRL